MIRSAISSRMAASSCGERGERGRVTGMSPRTRAGLEREQQQPVGEPNGLFDVVGHQQRRDGPAVDEVGKLVAQPRRQRVVERHERLVQQ